MPLPRGRSGGTSLRHGTPALCNDDLAPLPDLGQQRREVLAGLADSSGAHARACYGRRSATRMVAASVGSGVTVASAPSASIAA